MQVKKIQGQVSCTCCLEACNNSYGHKIASGHVQDWEGRNRSFRECERGQLSKLHLCKKRAFNSPKIKSVGA